MTDIERAKTIFRNGKYSCVLCKDDIIHISKGHGISPLLNMIEFESDLSRFSAANRVVGKAAAFLCVLAGVKNVYALVMSKSAIKVFERFQIGYSYEKLVKEVPSQLKSGPCPLEEAVRQITDPRAAYKAMLVKLEALKKMDGIELREAVV